VGGILSLEDDSKKMAISGLVAKAPPGATDSNLTITIGQDTGPRRQDYFSYLHKRLCGGVLTYR